MTWRKTRTTNSGKVRHTGLYRDPDGNERSAGTFSRVKDADVAAAAQEALVKTGQWWIQTWSSRQSPYQRSGGT